VKAYRSQHAAFRRASSYAHAVGGGQQPGQQRGQGQQAREREPCPQRGAQGRTGQDEPTPCRRTENGPHAATLAVLLADRPHFGRMSDFEGSGCAGAAGRAESLSIRADIWSAVIRCGDSWRLSFNPEDWQL
jgi:hypothetical protein